MKSFRSKPVGWRGESHRHYLAAKGIKTRYDARKDVKYLGVPLRVLKKVKEPYVKIDSLSGVVEDSYTDRPAIMREGEVVVDLERGDGRFKVIHNPYRISDMTSEELLATQVTSDEQERTADEEEYDPSVDNAYAEELEKRERVARLAMVRARRLASEGDTVRARMAMVRARRLASGPYQSQAKEILLKRRNNK